MAEEFGTPISPEEGGKNKTLLIVVSVVVVLCICCCVAGVALYYGIEPAMEWLGVPIPWY